MELKSAVADTLDDLRAAIAYKLILIAGRIHPEVYGDIISCAIRARESEGE